MKKMDAFGRDRMWRRKRSSASLESGTKRARPSTFVSTEGWQRNKRNKRNKMRRNEANDPPPKEPRNSSIMHMHARGSEREKRKPVMQRT